MIVTAQKNISYDLNYLREGMREANGRDVSDEEVIQVIWEYIREDFGDSYGVILLDEDGEEFNE